MNEEESAKLQEAIGLFLQDLVDGKINIDDIKQNNNDGDEDEFDEDDKNIDYDEEIDIIETFLTECTRKSNKNIPIQLLEKYFMNWYDIRFPHIEKMNKTEFNKYLKVYIKVEKLDFNGKKLNGIKNLKLITKDSDEDSDIEILDEFVGKNDIVSL